MQPRTKLRRLAWLKPLALPCLRHAVRFTTVGILAAKQVRSLVARSLLRSPAALASCRQSARAALICAGVGRPARDGDGECTVARGRAGGVGVGVGAGVAAGAGGGDADGGEPGVAGVSGAGCAATGGAPPTNTIAASAIGKIARRVMTCLSTEGAPLQSYYASGERPVKTSQTREL
jgi:hypothetical protein